MADSGLSSAFPPPPPEFEFFTDDNIALFRQDPTKVPDDVRSAMIPPPIPEKPYTIFGEQWQLEEKTPTLTDSGVQQLHPDEYDTRLELKKLIQSVLLNFLELINIMSHSPEQFPPKIEHIRTIMLNIHHLINSHRPIQTRCSLIQLMEEQIAQRTQEVQDLEAVTAQIDALIQQYASISQLAKVSSLVEPKAAGPHVNGKQDIVMFSNEMPDEEAVAKQNDEHLFGLLTTL